MTEVRSPGQPATIGTPSPPTAAPPRHARGARCWRRTEVDTRLLGHGGRAGGHLDRLPPPVRRRLPDRPQPLEPLGPEHVDRHHGDGHGPHHRVAQHRPVGRVAARLPRLHDGAGPDRRRDRLLRPRRDVRRLAAQLVLLGRRPCRRPPPRRARSAACRASSSPTSACPPSSSPSAGSSSGAGSIFRTGDKQGQTLAPLDETFQLHRRRSERIARRVAQLAARAPRPVPASPTASTCRPPSSAALRPRRATDVGRHRARRGRLRGRGRRRRTGRQQLPLPHHRRGHRRRLPGRDPDRRDAADDLPRSAAPLRALRLRLRRQPGGRRAERHQHPPHGDAHVRPDGRPVSPPAPPSRRRGSTRRSPTSACRTSSTSSPRPSSAARRSPAASARSPAPCSGAIVMQSLRSGMVLLKIDSPSQDIVVGVVLVAAVAVDAALRSGRRRARRRTRRRVDRGRHRDPDRSSPDRGGMHQ